MWSPGQWAHKRSRPTPPTAPPTGSLHGPKPARAHTAAPTPPRDAGALSISSPPSHVRQRAALHSPTDAPPSSTAPPSPALDDTRPNQAGYPQRVAQKPRCGFPTLYFVALSDHATRCGADMALGGVRILEGRLLCRPLRHLTPEDIVIVDRGPTSCPLIDPLHRLGAQVIGRKHQPRGDLAAFSGDIDERWQTLRTKATAKGRPPHRSRSIGVRVVYAALADGKALAIRPRPRRPLPGTLAHRDRLRGPQDHTTPRPRAGRDP
jgi:hypothetical protein